MYGRAAGQHARTSIASRAGYGNALMAGVVNGIGRGISTANTTYQHLGVRVATTGGNDALPNDTGAVSARHSIAWRGTTSRQTFPVIGVDAGREI